MSSKKKEMTAEECLEYLNKIKEQNRLRQQRFIEKKKATGEYEAYNEARTEYKREYRKNKNKNNDDDNDNDNDNVNVNVNVNVNNAKLKEQYNFKTLKELKELAKNKGLKGISKTNKNDLIEMLIKI